MERNGELWEEEILLNPVGVSRGGFGLNIAFLDEQTLLIDEDDALVIYDSSDCFSPQVIPIEAQRIWSIKTAGSGFVVYRALTNDANDSAQTDYFVREGSQYKIQQTLNDFFSAVSENIMVSLKGDTLITRQLDSSGMWVELPTATMEIEFVRFTTTVKLVDSQLVITNEDNIQFFNLNDSNTWDLSQQINLDIVEGPCDFGRCNRVSTSIEDGKIIVRDFNIQFDIVPVTHTIFERSGNGLWAEISTITLVDSDEDGGAAFAPSRHFSIVDNFALAEIPNGPLDRFTLAVFNLNSNQPAAEEPADASSNNSDDSIDSGVAPTNNTSNPGMADSDVTKTVTSGSGGGAIAPLALLLIMLNISTCRCIRRLFR